MKKQSKQIRIQEIAPGLMEGAKIAKYGTRGHLFILSPNGVLMSSRYRRGVVFYPVDSITLYFMPHDLSSLKKLGVISTAEIEASKKFVKSRQEKARINEACLKLFAAARILDIPAKSIRTLIRNSKR